MIKRLTNHGVFYDIDCVSLYLKRMEEIKNYKKYIAEEAHYFIESNKEQFQIIYDRVKDAENEYNTAFNQRFVTADGYSYYFVEFNNSGKAIINLQEDIPQQIVHRFKPLSLYPKENKKNLISDEIYWNNLQLSRLVSISIPLAIFLLVVVAGGIITSLFVDKQQIKLLIYIIGALLLPASLMLVVLHFSWKNRLKKKYYNGTNPFIFK